MRILVLFVFLSTLSVVSNGQDPIKEFNRYYINSVEKLQKLYGLRGSDPTCDTSFNIKDPLQSIEDLVSSYRKKAFSLGILFYNLYQDSLRIWLLKNGRLNYSIERITEDELLEAEKNLRLALRVDVLTTGRVPQKRSGIVSGTRENKSVSLDESVNVATKILLPEKIAYHLSGLEHLIIMPEFNIGQFPFYLLKPYGNTAYLIDSLSLSFAPHLCNLEAVVHNHRELFGNQVRYIPESPLIVGNPMFSSKTEYYFPSLKGAETEAKQVAELLGTKAYVGKEASKLKITEMAHKADLLYFATHGLYDSKKLLDGSFLAFAPDSSSKTGFWTAKEIQGTRLNATLAILSACQTGVGKIVGGGFIGIGRAFFISGVDNTIISLWSVDDQSTQNLMILFVKELLKENDFFPAGHLRKAILEYKKQDTNPAHWAPFMDFGFPY